MCASKKVERLFSPQINSRLEADFNGTLCHAFQQPAYALAYAKNLIDEIDVLHSALDQRVDLLKQSFHTAFTKLVAEQSLVAEGTGPWAAARKLQLRADALIT